MRFHKHFKVSIDIFAAEGSTPNLDRKVSRSLDPVFRADLCIGEIEILCLSRCRNSGGGGGECEENIECT
jgi:hypothetical protein